jgi:hypothetical protein
MKNCPWRLLTAETLLGDMSGASLSIQDGTVLLVEVWGALRTGSLIVVEGHSTDTEHTLTLEPRSGGVPPREEDLFLLEAWFRQGSLSALAIERSVSPSSIAGSTRAAVQAMGVSRPTRAPVLLIWAYLAANAKSSARASAAANDGRIHIRYPRRDAFLTDVLTETGAAIISLYIQGHDVDEIAKMRGTRSRVIGATCSNACRTLKAHGRLGLISLIGRQALGLERNA